MILGVQPDLVAVGPALSPEAEAQKSWSGSHNLLLFPEALQTQTVELEFGKLGFFPLE